MNLFKKAQTSHEYSYECDFVSNTQTLSPINIKEFTAQRLLIFNKIIKIKILRSQLSTDVYLSIFLFP